MKVENGVLIKVEPGDIKDGSFHSWEGITSIGEYAFSARTSLKSLILPPNITKIERFAFANCESLKYLVLPPNITKIEQGTFTGCKSLKPFVLPPNITSIGWAAFKGCESLTSFGLPPNITSIGERAFVCCKSLKYLILPPNITKIEQGTFSRCESLESLALSPNITKIEQGTFSRCTSLKSLVLSPNITSIGDWAFTACISLEVIYIPACDDATRARIIALLPKELRSKVAPAGLLEEILSIRDRQLQRIVLTPYTNPMGRIAKSGLPIPDDVLREMNGLLGEDNRFLSKARSQIEATPLPSNVDDYQQKVQAIVDEAIVRSKSGITPPVMPEVLEQLERLEDKASDLTKRGEKAASNLQDLCKKIKQHHNALVSGRLDLNAFQEKCKQAIEQKREVLGGVKSALNSVGSDPAFFKTHTHNLLDALMETIKKEAPNHSIVSGRI